MRKQYLKTLFMISFLALMAVLILIYTILWYNGGKLQGKMVFANSYNNGEKVDKINIITAEDAVELELKNSYWLVKGKGEYYADFSKVHSFLTSVNSSSYLVKMPFSQELLANKYLYNPKEQKENSGMLVQIFAGDVLLDEIIIGLPDEDKKYYFVRNIDDDSVWQIDGNFKLPIMEKDWLLTPVFSVSPNTIESLGINNNIVTREDEHSDFTNEKGYKVNADVLTNILNYIEIQDAVKADKADFENFDIKEIYATTFYGLKVNLTLYYNNQNDIWFSIKLLTTPLPMKIVNDYIKDNSFLYDDWYFKASSEQGHILRDFRLM
ncbi:MAG: DUF4340 domain-containing protein [Alphaproteobacteria bacterium]|nr:DUF4340 domain-containing protein [Alphaproteobacteria bacterium]